MKNLFKQPHRCKIMIQILSPAHSKDSLLTSLQSLRICVWSVPDPGKLITIILLLQMYVRSMLKPFSVYRWRDPLTNVRNIFFLIFAQIKFVCFGRVELMNLLWLMNYGLCLSVLACLPLRMFFMQTVCSD